MKFLCDVHIPIKLSKHIGLLGLYSEHVNNILDKWNTTDDDITTYADQHDLIVVTKDQDFRNSFLLKRTPKKLIKVNLGNISNDVLISIFENQMTTISEIDRLYRSYMIELGRDSYRVVTA
ncbi:MAG: DUF5615 family PIN-like protein [Bacteroidota bacterium]